MHEEIEKFLFSDGRHLCAQQFQSKSVMFNIANSAVALFLARSAGYTWLYSSVSIKNKEAFNLRDCDHEKRFITHSGRTDTVISTLNGN